MQGLLCFLQELEIPREATVGKWWGRGQVWLSPQRGRTEGPFLTPTASPSLAEPCWDWRVPGALHGPERALPLSGVPGGEAGKCPLPCPSPHSLYLSLQGSISLSCDPHTWA